MKDKIYDVAVIGGGITGTGVIHELAKYKLETALLERGLDLAVGATKGNGGVVHPGYDPHPGTLKAKLNPAGARMYPRLSKELGFGLRRTGTLVVAYSDRDLKKVDELLDNAAVNGVDQVEKIDAAQLRHREPHISQAALGALLAHTTTMIDPFEVAIAFAENAQDNGADILTGQNVTDLRKEDDGLFHITASGNQYLAEMEQILHDAVVKATQEAPLRHNSVETFDEYNTGKNVGKGVPSIFWDIVPGSDELSVHTYMAGGGCSLPGKAMVLMPGEGYEGVTRFVLDVMTSYGLNACPPLLVGVGIATSVETAALLSKKALMRPLGSHNANERAAKMEALLEDGINQIGLGPQGLTGKNSVLGVHIENTARHPSVIGVAVNVGCWSHRRGHIVFDRELNYTINSHAEVAF